MIANIGGGGDDLYGAPASKRISAAEYGAFGVMLAVAMCVPNMPLQMVFAQQTARALATGRERATGGHDPAGVAGHFRSGAPCSRWRWIWQANILSAWKLPSATGLWITLAVVLFSFWLPMFLGVMQGQQNFFWMGWVNIFNGAGRLGWRRLGFVRSAGFGRDDHRRLPGPGHGGGHRHLADPRAMAVAGGAI